MFLFFILIIKSSLLNSEIIFRDDFDIDYTNNWVALGAGEIGCTLIYDRDTCYTSNEINMRTINGTLALTAIHEQYFDKVYTSGSIEYKEKLEIEREYNYLFRTRVAKPTHRGLIGKVMLDDEDDTLKPFEILYITDNYTNGFYIFEFEISDQLIWKFNKEISQKKSRDELNNNHKFNLKISLQINISMFKEDSTNLNCSSLIVDFVEFYKFNKSFRGLEPISVGQNSDKINGTKLNANEICKNLKTLMPHAEIKPVEHKEFDLLWSDDFEGETLNLSNWDFVMEKNCSERYCINYNVDDHFKVSNGSLKILSPRKILKTSIEYDKIIYYYIVSKNCFQNVRIEFRARIVNLLKKINNLISFVGSKGTCNKNNDREYGLFMNFRQCDLSLGNMKQMVHPRTIQGLTINNSEIVESYIYVKTNKYNPHHPIKPHYTVIKENLDEFQIYGIQWNDYGAQWLLNGRVISQANSKYNQIGQPIDFNAKLPYDNPLAIMLSMSTIDASKDNEPTIFEIDYVKVYGHKVPSISSSSRSGNSSLIIITTALVVLSVTTIILLIIKRRLFKNNQREENYDDINNRTSRDLNDTGDNVYEVPNYENPYEIVTKYERESYKNNEYLEIIASFEDLN